MQLTPNYNLRKPSQGEPLTANDVSINADIIDSALAQGHTGTAKELAWTYYGDGHTIVDNSSGTLPGGNFNAENPWSPSYPVLVGYNGTNTYGVRVDSARVADRLASIEEVTNSIDAMIYSSLLKW